MENIDDKATICMVHVHETFLPTLEASLMIPHVVVFTVFLSLNGTLRFLQPNEAKWGI